MKMPRNKRPLFVAAASVVIHESQGFVSNPLRVSILHKRSTGNNDVFRPTETVLFNRDPYDSKVELEISPLLLETSSATDESSTRTSTTAMTVTVETMEQSSDPDGVLQSVNVNNEILGSPPPQIGAETTAATTMMEPIVPVAELLVTRNDDVKAVLKASELAVVEAEASIPPDLMEQLGFSANAQPHKPHVDAVPDLLTATSVVGEPVTSTKLDPPTISKIIKFAIPAIGVWLCGPLLSLIDTSAVGLFSGTAQQAALNPAVALTDYSALLIAFMYTGATNLVAAAQDADRGTSDKPATTRVLTGSMRLSTYVGAGLGAVLFVLARPLLKAIIGNDAISPEVFAAAMKYVRIRALGMPAAAIIGSTQAACLGMQDIRSPLYVLVAAALVNLFGDIMFVGNSHSWIGGAAGAAWATVISQYAGVFLFVKWLTNKRQLPPRIVNVSTAILELTGKSKSDGSNRRKELQAALQAFGSNMKTRTSAYKKLMPRLPNRKNKMVPIKTAPVETIFTVRGFLHDRFSFRDLVTFPSVEMRKEFAPFLGPVTITQVGRVAGYVAMSHVVASSLGTISMAAQQVIVSLFYCLCPIADSLSLTAQSFLPSIAARPPSRERSAALRTTVLNFVKAGAIFGGALVGVVGGIPLISGMFTSDAAVIRHVNSVVPSLVGFFALHGMVLASEGALLGQKDLSFLGRMYALFFFAVPYFMLRLKSVALAGTQVVDLTSVWTVFLGYQTFRATAWLSRVAFLQKRNEEESSRMPEASV